MKPMALPKETIQEIDDRLVEMRNRVLAYRWTGSYEENDANRALLNYAGELEHLLSRFFPVIKKLNKTDPGLLFWIDSLEKNKILFM